MCAEILQVGPWPFCVGWLVALLPLAGVVIGVVMGFGASIILDNRRRRRELREKWREEQREALKLALKWFEPLERFLSDADFYSVRFAEGEIEKHEFIEKYPDNVWEEIKIPKTPEHLAMHLPKDTFSRLRDIDRCLIELYALAFKVRETYPDGIRKLHDFSSEMFTKTEDLWHDIRAEYEKSFK